MPDLRDTPSIPPLMPPAEHDTPPRTRSGWDFALVIATVVLLGSLGVQSLYGTLYSWWAQRTIAGWEQLGYPSFVDAMNAFAAPQVVALVVVMGLCVPKRLFSRTLLLGVSAAMVAIGLTAWLVTRDIGRGLSVYLGLAALIQVAVVVMTVAGVRGPSYLTEGRVAKTGSGLLHLGFVLFALVVAGLQRSAWMLPVFAAASVLAVGGSAMSFYANALSKRLRGRA